MNLARRDRDREEHKLAMIAWQFELQTQHVRLKAVGWVTRTCAACDLPYEVPGKWKYRFYCLRCSADAHYVRQDAGAAVQQAIRLGRLMRPYQFRCMDCEEWATSWDHRDYSKPLQVEPVCDRHNRIRPPAFRRPALAVAS